MFGSRLIAIPEAFALKSNLAKDSLLNWKMASSAIIDLIKGSSKL